MGAVVDAGGSSHLIDSNKAVRTGGTLLKALSVIASVPCAQRTRDTTHHAGVKLLSRTAHHFNTQT